MEAESCLESAIARSMASLVCNGGGLIDLSVKDPSCWGIVEVRDRVKRSSVLMLPSLCVLFCVFRFLSSISCLSRGMPDQSPDSGLADLKSGDADKGVRASTDCQRH